MSVPLAGALALPVMDGEKDTEYTLVANSPKDNLLTTGVDVNSNPYNDETDPVAKALDVTGLWASNTGSDLYFYIEMPYLDLNVISGEWALVMHLGGANDGIQRLGTASDPYGAPCDYGHSPAVNAVLKSNMAGFKHGSSAPVGFDGNQGYAFLNSTTNDNTGWTWDTGNFLFSSTWVDDTTNNLIHGQGTGGGEIVYKAGKGIEVKVPLALFAANPSNTALTAPKVGDVISVQFYDNVRYYSSGNVGTEKYPRGPTDCVTYEDGLHTDPLRGYITQWATYTMKAPATLEVSAASLVDARDTGHIFVGFTASVSDGATTTSNYSVVDETTGNPVPVTTATVDPANDTHVILGLTLPFNTKLRVTVSNVKGVNGATVSSTLNTAEAAIGTPVQFTMADPYGIIAAIGTNPTTGAAYRVSVTGDPIGWANYRPPLVPPAGKDFGYNEIAMNPVSGQPNTYQSAVVIANPGVMGYKYCLPEEPDSGSYDGWNALNPNNRRYFVPASSNVLQIVENAAGPYAGTNYDGGPVSITCTLIDHDNLAAGHPVYVAGTFNGWTGNVAGATPLAAVPGQPNTYSGTFTTPAGYGSDTVTEYKYILIYDDPANPGTSKTDWDTLNPLGNRWCKIKGSGTPLVQSISEFVGSTKTIRILRIATGLDTAPQFGNYYTELDLDKSGSITLIDAVKSLKG
jgi:hypothetical protein